MKSFPHYFYHDVMIKSMLYNLNEVDGTNSISFVLDNSELNDAEEIGLNNDEYFKDVKCIFANVHQSSVNLFQNIRGNYFIQLAEITDTDSFIVDYKNIVKNILPIIILDNLKC